MPTLITTTVGLDAGDDYATWTAAIADNFGATSKDLVANDEAILCEIGNDWAGDGLEDALVLTGWTTDATRNITIRAQAGDGTDGTPGSGARWWQGGASTTPAIDVGDESHITFVGEATANTNANAQGYVVLGEVAISMSSADAAVVARDTARLWLLSTGGIKGAVLLAKGADGEPLEQ